MPSPPALAKVVRFDGFEVDLATGQLHKSGLRISLREKSFQVLAALLEHPGLVVTREELRQRLWPEDVFVDFDNNLNTAVARLREALGDSADVPQFIETLPKRGYRFLAHVFEAPRAPEPERAPRVRLVVLPFINLHADPAQEYFSDAVTDQIITELASLAPEQLAVIALTTAMHYKGSHKDVARIGRELGVDYVVEGGVHRTEDRIGINVQLIQVSDQTHLFARKYDAPLRDIFNEQSRVALDLADHIGVTPVPEGVRAAGATEKAAGRKPTEDLAAYNEYIQGRYYLSKLSPEALAKARQHFEEAVRRDPDFALAHDSLAETYWWHGYFGFMPPRDAFSIGVLHAVRALEIDNTLAETHALVAQYHKQIDYNWPEVEREMGRALALNPNSPLVRMRYAWNFLMPHGRLEEAVAELEFALELDPLSTYFRTAFVFTFLFWRRYDRTLAEAQRLLELDPTACWAYIAIGAYHRERRRFEEAIAAYRKAVEFSGGSAAITGWLGMSLGLSGNKAEARALLKRLHGMAAQAYVPPTSFAWIHLGLGEIDSAFEWLDRAVDERDQYLMPIKSYAFLDPIRSDPRFLAPLLKMNLEP